MLKEIAYLGHFISPPGKVRLLSAPGGSYRYTFRRVIDILPGILVNILLF